MQDLGGASNILLTGFQTNTYIFQRLYLDSPRKAALESWFEEREATG